MRLVFLLFDLFVQITLCIIIPTYIIGRIEAKNANIKKSVKSLIILPFFFLNVVLHVVLWMFFYEYLKENQFLLLDLFGVVLPAITYYINRNERKKTETRMLCHIALLVALEIVLNRFLSINTAGWKIGFSFVPIVICAMLYGPGWGAVTYALADFLGAILFPMGAYHPGFTIMAAVRGAMYGYFLYKGNMKLFGLNIKWDKIRLFPNILIPTIVNCVIVSLFIDTTWVAMLYGSKTYWGWFVYRIPQFLLLIPLNIILIPVLDKLATQLIKLGLAGKKRTIKVKDKETEEQK